ncbi:hypothetical protein DGG96_18290 [Legionella qingyii]|uniref:Uncharacterized protein n=1 Tax=Legionella qingyii TaxID=2184757 RepID=A0A317TXG9_9GAMM|nr:hypothetical protein [Legionella qingyii]PWY54223.1 hypothetical protein DGG96_18290 [Legionella qingyii]RUR19805.1 hypothetical protein ELY20_15410 [Legionella qingyii]RUR22187.1 hypothetical protein ELY16_15270 [Legionella qingyii]
MKSISEIKELLVLCDTPANISADLMAFFLYLKEMKREKNYKFKAFAMCSDEIDLLHELIEHMIEYCNKDLRFQIAISKWDGSEQLNHWSFLEFNFKRTNSSRTLDILICDPLGFEQSLVLTNLLSSKMRFGNLSKKCSLTVYIPTDILQIKGRICAYFVTDSISMLSNQDRYCPIYDYMNSHQQKEKNRLAVDTLNRFRMSMVCCYMEDELDSMYQFNMVISSLPVRLLRTKQLISDLEREVRDSEFKEEIVNGKGETAWGSIDRNLFFVKDRQSEEQHRNMRVNKKMEKLVGMASEASSSLSSSEDVQLINEGIQKHRISGLEKLIKQHSDQCALSCS